MSICARVPGDAAGKITARPQFLSGATHSRVAVFAFGVGDHVEVVPATGASRQAHRRRAGVAGVGREPVDIGVQHASEGGRAFGDERRVAAEINGVDPAARTGPDGVAEVADGPAERRFLAREAARLATDVGDAQVGGCGTDLRRGGQAVVVFVCFADAAAGVSAHDQVAAADRWSEPNGLAECVALAEAQRSALADVSEVPEVARDVPVGAVAEVDRVCPGAGKGVTTILDAVAEAVAVAGQG